MSTPPHPGRGIRENCLIPLGLNVTEAARVLGVARHTLSRVLNGRAAISPEMAIRLEKAGWSNAGFWLRRQASYDLAQARKREHGIDVAPYEAGSALSGRGSRSTSSSTPGNTSTRCGRGTGSKNTA